MEQKWLRLDSVRLAVFDADSILPPCLFSPGLYLTDPTYTDPQTIFICKNCCTLEMELRIGRKKPHSIAPALFCVVHGGIGVLKQYLILAAVFRVDGNADA